jgi:hypothetical protein
MPCEFATPNSEFWCFVRATGSAMSQGDGAEVERYFLEDQGDRRLLRDRRCQHLSGLVAACARGQGRAPFRRTGIGLTAEQHKNRLLVETQENLGALPHDGAVQVKNANRDALAQERYAEYLRSTLSTRRCARLMAVPPTTRKGRLRLQSGLSQAIHGRFYEFTPSACKSYMFRRACNHGRGQERPPSVGLSGLEAAAFC